MKLDEAHPFLSDQLAILAGTGGSASPHVHRAHADAFYVLDGELEFAGTALRVGGFGFASPNVVHWFDAERGRYLNIHAPGRYWAERVRARVERRRIPAEVYDTFDPEKSRDGAVIVNPREGDELVSNDRTMHVKAAAPELCLFEVDAPPSYEGPPLHFHAAHVDAFYVLEGVLDVVVDGVTHRAAAGDLAVAMPREVHTFVNPTSERVRYLNFHAPGVRFDEYIRRMDAGESGRRFRESFDVYEVEVS